MHKKRKKKKLRIRADRVSGSKTVFGEDGEALDPMEALARAIQVGSRVGRGVCCLCSCVVTPQSAHPPQALQTEDVTAEGGTQEDRFERHKTLMRERDAGDKAEERRRRQEAKADKKRRQRAAAVVEAAMEDEGVTLGGASASDDDDPGSDDELPAPYVPQKRRNAEGAYLGMALREDDEHVAGGDSDDGGARDARGRAKRARGVGALDVGAQEQLALKLLGMA